MAISSRELCDTSVFCIDYKVDVSAVAAYTWIFVPSCLSCTLYASTVYFGFSLFVSTPICQHRFAIYRDHLIIKFCHTYFISSHILCIYTRCVSRILINWLWRTERSTFSSPLISRQFSWLSLEKIKRGISCNITFRNACRHAFFRISIQQLYGISSLEFLLYRSEL